MTIRDLEDIDEGQLCDMLIEAANDAAVNSPAKDDNDVVREATQADIDRFFGG
jgi:hypothetical protein